MSINPYRLIIETKSFMSRCVAGCSEESHFRVTDVMNAFNEIIVHIRIVVIMLSWGFPRKNRCDFLSLFSSPSNDTRRQCSSSIDNIIWMRISLLISQSRHLLHIQMKSCKCISMLHSTRRRIESIDISMNGHLNRTPIYTFRLESVHLHCHRSHDVPKQFYLQF